MSVLVYFSVLLAILLGLAVVWMLRRRRFIPTIRQLPLGVVLIACTGWLAALFIYDRMSGSASIAFDEIRRPSGAVKAIVLIHGWTGERATWSSLMSQLVDDVRFAEYDIVSLGYTSQRLFERVATLEKVSQALVSLLASELPDHEIYILGHSTGGIIGRILVLDLATRGVGPRAQRLVTIAAPHAGTELARTAGYLGVTQVMLSQLSDNSLFLKELRARWRSHVMSAGSRLREVCIASRADQVVTFASATAECGDVALLSAWGHEEMHRPTDRSDERYRVITGALLDRSQ
jgi:pimeloyl-ACP methyl ester carboxylesterase